MNELTKVAILVNEYSILLSKSFAYMEDGNTAMAIYFKQKAKEKIMELEILGVDTSVL